MEPTILKKYASNFKKGRPLFLIAGYLVTSICLIFGFSAAQAESNQKTEQLQLVIKVEKPYYKAGEPISIAGEIRNITPRDLFFYTIESTTTVTYDLRGPSGELADVVYYISDPPLPQKEHFAMIKGGESLLKHFNISVHPEKPLLPGIYTLSVTYKGYMNWYLDFDSEKMKRVDLNAWTGTMKSNAVKVEIR